MVVLTAHVPWPQTLSTMVVPHLSFDASEATTVVGMLGTTISAQLFS